jgi:hypothetical protein
VLMTMNKRAERVVDFLSGLHGMDRLRNTPGIPSDAAIDLVTATVIEPSPDDPEGEFMRVEHPLGRVSYVATQKLVEALLVRHSQAMAIISPDGGDARDHYRRIRDAYVTKTGSHSAG